MTLKNFSYFLLLSLLIISLYGCSSDTAYIKTDTDIDTTADEAATNQSNLTLSFSLSLTLDSEDDDWDFSVNLPTTYALDLNKTSNGNITMQAHDLPQMVYRVCTVDSDTENCQAFSDQTGGFDVDLVIDSCGRFVADENCGENDDTQFTGTIYSDGSMFIENISIRIRTFLVDDDSSGLTAKATDPGLMDINRLVTTLTTDTVTVNDLSATGDLITDKQVTLVSAGTLSSVSDTFPGANYLAILEGSFNNPPLALSLKP
ncbi:MAG: hypothetical protein ABII18_02655 [bacterium]|nr:hypothetical protein [bacterium]MBU1916542.1 hypothetical protein [bacterium]